jgi:hypothetical protein
MNHAIDLSLEVSWCIELEDGTKIFDKKNTDRAEWFKVKDWLIDNSDRIIKNLHLFATKNATCPNTFNGACCSEGRHYYFFSKKIVAVPGLGQHLLWGIGSCKDDDEDIHIKWYNQDIVLLYDEVRPVNKVSLILIG